MRRSLYQPLSPDDLPDLVLPLSVVERGYRVVYEPAAMLAETPLMNPVDEYRMRVRVALRALWTVSDMRRLLNVRKYGWYAVQVFSHKVLRYLAFFFVALLFATSAWLSWSNPLYAAACLLQATALCCGIVGYVVARRGTPSRSLTVPYYFALVNCASLHAVWKFLNRERPRVWTPRLG
jgi:hypothetical protein